MPTKRAAAPPTRKTAPKAVAKRRATRRGPAGPRGPEPGDSAIALDHPDVARLEARIRDAGGAALAAYRDPYARSPLILASLPLRAIEPTPFQRDLSRVHADRLGIAIDAVGIFLDPVIAVPTTDGFSSPNGRHRLAAAKKLGLRSVTALVVADPALAYRILPLNTEKAHNLRDRSLVAAISNDEG